MTQIEQMQSLPSIREAYQQANSLNQRIQSVLANESLGDSELESVVVDVQGLSSVLDNFIKVVGPNSLRVKEVLPVFCSWFIDSFEETYQLINQKFASQAHIDTVLIYKREMLLSQIEGLQSILEDIYRLVPEQLE